MVNTREATTFYFRFFQVATSTIADERRSLALFYADGNGMRFAWNQDEPPPIPKNWPAWRRYIEYLRKKASEIPPTQDGLLSLGREGMAYGGAYWSPVRCGAARYHEGTFLEMVQDARLVVP